MPRPPDTVSKDEAIDAEFKGMTEIQFQRWVEVEAKENGWLVHHTHDSRRNSWTTDPGLPDLILVRGGILIFAELKKQKGKVTKKQQIWLDALNVVAASVFDFIRRLFGSVGAGFRHKKNRPIQVCLWRPLDWREIREVLQ